MQALLRALAATTIVVAVGCKPTFRDCAVRCGANDLCPSGTSCESDGFCHSPGAIERVCDELDLDGGGGPDAVTRCAPPLLLVAIQNLGDGTGRIRRYSIGATAVTRCNGDLTADGTLDADVMAIAWVPPESVAIVTQGQILRVDVQTDRVAWTVPVESTQTGLPVDATVIGVATPSLLLGLDSKLNSVGDVRFVERHQLDNGAFIGSNTLSFDPERLARNPEEPNQILVLKTGSFAAAKTDPTAGSPAQLVPDVANADLHTIRALFDTPVFVAWTGTPSGNRDGVYYFRAGLATALGPVRCDALARTYVDVAPDPDRSHFGFFAITELAGVREVVHFASTGGPCDSIVSSTMLPSEQRIGAIGVVDR